MKKYYKIVSIISLLLFVFSCDDTTNPSSSYIIEKNVIASSEEQIFESGNDFKIVFPPNAINQNLELKVKKESSAPTLTIPNMKLGKNIFKLSFEGFQSFTKTVKVYLNFDASKIEKGKTPEEAVKGLIFVNGKWKEADFEIDKVNNKIIFNLNNLNSKNSKDEPVFLANDEIILGDGYTTTDVGQSDDQLAKLKYFTCNVELGDFIVIRQSTQKESPFEYPKISSSSTWENGPGDIDTILVKWSGTKFNVVRQFKNSINDINLSISGDINKQTWICSNLIYNYNTTLYLGENQTKIVDIKIKFKPILSFFKDLYGTYMLNIDTYKTFEQGKYDHDLIKHIEEVSFTLTLTQDGNTIDIYTLKQLNDNPKLNTFSLRLCSNP